jgi:hypothetical protein
MQRGQIDAFNGIEYLTGLFRTAELMMPWSMVPCHHNVVVYSEKSYACPEIDHWID